MDKLIEKEKKLRQILKDMGSIVIAYSGGVDSTYLLKVAYDELRNKCLGVIGNSESYPKSEFENAVKYAKKLGVRYKVINTKELFNKTYKLNNSDRCYYCKTELFTKLKNIAKKNNIKYVIDGSNYDDGFDYRPGIRAACKLGVKSPLKDVMLTKKEIRYLSKKHKLSSWNKPSSACLSSRIPYGSMINSKKLEQVEKAEIYMKKLGFKQVRVRHHEYIARIEVNENELNKVINNRRKIIKNFSKIGFLYITLDLTGYKTGSLNKLI